MTDEKKRKVLEAAFSVFMRYGFKRVTMNDIAEESEMSRPALYLLFPNKEEIFKAVLVEFGRATILKVREGLGQFKNLDEKLDYTFKVWVLEPYELVAKSPDAKELANCSHGFASDITQDIYKQMTNLFVDIITPYIHPNKNVKIEIPALAQLLTLTLRGFKENAADIKELKQLLQGLLTMTLATLKIKS